MHRNQFRPDKEATKARGFASKFSYVSFRIHPGTESQQCEYLAGLEDIGKRHAEIMLRDEERCVDCGQPGTYDDPLELAHGGHTKISRCWCPQNLSMKHRHACHGKNDHHGRF